MTAAIEQSPPSRETLLAELVPGSLARTPIRRASWNFWQTVFLGISTAGLLPLLVLPKKFARQVGHEQQQYERLAELLTLLTRGDEAEWIDKTARAMKVNRGFRVLTLICALAGLGGFVVAIAARQPTTWQELLTFFMRPPRVDEPAAIIHIAAVTIGMLLLRFQLTRQAQRVRSVSHAVDLLCERYGVKRPKPPRLGWGIEPVWLVAGVGLAGLGMLWALPLMLAVGGHRRYTKGVSQPYRRRLADVVRELRALARPVPEIHVLATDAPLCHGPNCGATLPSGARFCPRCGQAA